MILARFVAAIFLCFSVFAQQPNTLIVIADDLGVDAVGAYHEGTSPPPTPTIDSLAARGVLFRNCWSNAVCSPTRSSIYTGRHATRTFVGYVPNLGGGELRTEEITLPELLSAVPNALIGKWHLGVQLSGDLTPNTVGGWQHYAGFLHGYTPDYYLWSRTVNGVTANCPVYATTQMVDDALSWIGSQSSPWLCVLAFNAPHVPLHAPPSHLHTQDLAGKTPQSDPLVFFAAVVQALDTELGRLLGQIDPNTNIIFLGDNGTDPGVSVPPFLPTHAKATPYEGGINVPLIVAGPAVVSGGREAKGLVGSVDLFATVAELHGVNARAVIPPWIALDSISLLPYLQNPVQNGLRPYLFSEQFQGTSFSSLNTNGWVAIRGSRYKLIRFFSGSTFRDEVYDLQNDPFERQNLASRCPTLNQGLTCLGLRNELGRMRAPRAAFFSLGSPCSGSAGPLVTSVQGSPVIGQSYVISVSGVAPSSSVTFLIGKSTSVWGNTLLPLELSPGCYLYSSGEICLPLSANSQGLASHSIAVPNVVDLVGGAAMHAWLISDPAVGLVASESIVAVVGF